MHKRDFIILGLAAAIVAVIVAISPHVEAVTNEASTEVYGIDILGLTKNAHNLPEQHYAAH